MSVALYRAATTVLGPLIEGVLSRRLAQGTEDPDRVGERRGIAALARPEGSLVWMHAASVGESIALLPLIERLLEHRPDLHLLMTTGSVTSAEMMTRRLPDGVIHQFVPVDRQAWVTRFLDHWQPGLAIWIESDLWPNLVLETLKRGVPMALVDGRLSEKSYRSWRRFRPLVRPLFAAFDRILTVNEDQAGRFRDLGARNVLLAPSLKAAGAPAPVDPAFVSDLSAAIGSRPVWLAASTHPGEDEIVLDAHQALTHKFPDLLTVLAPRHPHRASDVARLVAERGLPIARRSDDALPKGDTGVFLVDTMGEMGSLYSVVPVTFLAGSLVPVGGHNPIEAAHAGTAIVFGRLMTNNRRSADELLAAGAAIEVADADSLTAAVGDLLSEPDRAHALGQAAQSVAATERAGAETVFRLLQPMIPTERSVDARSGS